MPRKKQMAPASRTVALCYVRLSFTREADDANSPERQRANIQAVCTARGWTPEWYQDTEGHKSGTKEKNRPQWLALKARMTDPDIAAIVANDLSRLHRKGWRVGDLLDFVEEHGVDLVLAAPGRQLDLSTPQGKLFAIFAAMFDEWYAADISQRQKDSIAHRKAQGKSVGTPPFGTARDREGYLHPSKRGAWLMPDGTFVAGREDEPPDPGALWRGYFAAAERSLRLYVIPEKRWGLEKVAYQLNLEGWAFKDRNGTPRPFERDDVRRIIGNWPEYGGIVMEISAKKRRAWEMALENIPFIEERAVFDLKLLREVAQVRRDRTVKRTDHGVNIKTYPYPLNGITYCAHCEALAEKHANPKLRSHLGGQGHPKMRRYRHKQGTSCGCMNRSVPAAIFEADFARLIKLLTVRPDALQMMTELSIQSDKAFRRSNAPQQDPEIEKREAITLCRRKIEAAVILFGDGRIDHAEYQRRVESNEREIAHWEARTTETEKSALELTLCLDVIDKIVRLWDISEDEDRQGMIRTLFTHIIYDLDTRRIVDFKLKPWADRFLTLRAALYEIEENGGTTQQNTPQSDDQGVCTDVPLWGFEPQFWP